MATFSAILRFFAFICMTLMFLPVHLAVWGITGSVAMAALWHRMACLIFNIRVRLVGTPDTAKRPVVFLSNHISYLDIVALGAHLDAIFVAKSEVAGWPVFGFLAKTQRTVFIQRKRQAMAESQNKIAAILREGRNIILFGEGTSTDGRAVLPFKAGLLDILFDHDLNVGLQPVAIVLERVGGQVPDDQAVRDLYAWWRPETTLAPHLWEFARKGGAELSIHFLPVLDPAAFADRKALAVAAQKAVADSVGGPKLLAPEVQTALSEGQRSRSSAG